MTRQVARLSNQVYAQSDHDWHHHPRHDLGEFLSHQHEVEEHPTIIVDTEPHSYTAHSGDEFIVTDDHHGESGEDHLFHELGEISAWLGEHFVIATANDAPSPKRHYMDSKHDLEAARAANKYL